MATQKEYTMLFALNASLQSGFQASFGRAQQTITGLQKQINDLAKTQSNIAGYEKQQRAVESTRNKLEMYKQQLENLKGATASSSVEEAQLTNAMLAKEQQIQRTEAALQGQTDRLNQMGDALREAGVDTDHLADESRRLGQEISDLRDEQEQAADGAESFGDRTVAAFDAMASAIVAAGIVDKLKEIGEAYFGMVQTAGNFEASMSQVAATMGISNAEVGELGEFAKKMGAETSFSAVQAADGLNILAMAGLNANDQMAGLPIVLNLAAAGGMDMAQSASYITAAVKGFGDTMDHAGYYADLMAKGASLANTNVQGLGEAFAGTAANAKTYNQAADSVTLSLLRLAEQNVTGSSAATALNRAYADLFTPTAKEAKKAIAELGVAMYDVNTGEARDFNDIVDDMNAVLSEYSQEEANALKATIFTAQGLNAFNKMTASSTERVQELWQGIGEAGGSAAAQANTQLDNMNGELTIMNSALEGVQISMGDLYRDDMRQLYKIGTQLLTMLNNFIKQNPGLVKGIIAAGTALGVLTTGVIGVSTAIKAFTTLTTFLGPTMMATLGPIMAVVGGLSLLAGAFMMAYEHSDAKAIKDLTTESRGLESAMKDLHTKYETQAADNAATAATAQMYIDKLRDLEAAGLADDEQKRQYHNTLELLVQTMPSLADKIDLVNDSIEGGLPALEKATNDWKKMAEQQAQEEYLGELRQKVVDATKERIRNEQSLTAAQIKSENATKKQSAVYQQLLSSLNLTDDQFKSIYGSVRDMPWMEMSKDVQDLYREYSNLGQEIKNSEAEQRQLSAALEQSDAAIAAATTVVDEYTASVEAQKAAAEANAGAQSSVEAAVEGVSNVLSGTEEQLRDLSEAYDAAYQAAEKSIGGQYSLWDEVGQTSAVSADTLNQRIQEQTQHWSDYNDNLAKLRERTGDIEGLSEVIGSFADGSQESINAIAGMADASDEDLQAMVTNYQALKTAQDETGQNIAALATNFDTETQNIANSVEKMVGDINLSSEASAAAGETIQAYINKASSMTGPTEAAFRQVAAAAQRGLNSGGGGAPEGKAIGGPVFSGKTYLVGEEGPELLRMNGSGTVIPHDETRKILSDAAATASGADTIRNSVSVTFQINGSAGMGVVDQLRAFGADFEERVLEVIENAQADSMRRRYA